MSSKANGLSSEALRSLNADSLRKVKILREVIDVIGGSPAKGNPTSEEDILCAINLIHSWCKLDSLVYDLYDVSFLLVPCLIELLEPFKRSSNLIKTVLETLLTISQREDIKDHFNCIIGTKIISKVKDITIEKEVLILCDSILNEINSKELSSRRLRTYHFGKLNPISQKSEYQINLRLGSFSSCDIGWKIWEGAMIMCRWMALNPHIFQGKRVLELGAGCGLCGILCAYFCDSIILSDFLDPLIDLLKENVARNSDVEKKIQVERIDWLKMETWDKFGKFDIIIGSEIVYQELASEAVADIVKNILKEDGVFFCSTMEKYRLGLPRFLQKAESLDLDTKVTKVDDSFIQDFSDVNEWVILESHHKSPLK